MKVIKTVVPMLVAYVFTFVCILFTYSQVVMSQAVERYEEAVNPVEEQVEEQQPKEPTLEELYNGKVVQGQDVVKCIDSGKAAVTVVTNQGVRIDVKSSTDIQPELLAQLADYNYAATVEGNSVIFVYSED